MVALAALVALVISALCFFVVAIGWAVSVHHVEVWGLFFLALALLLDGTHAWRNRG